MFKLLVKKLVNLVNCVEIVKWNVYFVALIVKIFMLWS